MTTNHRISLPQHAKTFLAAATRRHTERVLLNFHRWLLERGLDCSNVTSTDLRAFLDRPAGAPIKPLTRNSYRYELKHYLLWLEERGLAGPFENQELEGYHRKGLPEDVKAFLRFLAPTKSQGTVRVYKSALRRFRAFLEAKSIPIEAVDRSACLAWSQAMFQEGLHPATRVGQLVCIRKYIDWRWEQGLAPVSGRAMVLSSDLPKKPEYLPRPLPPESDRELQSKLKTSNSSVGLGLYVMRRTGIRVGELRMLERDCIRVDNNGSHFLKVPLQQTEDRAPCPVG